MPTVSIPAVSKEYLKGTITTQAVPLDTQNVQVAFLPNGTSPDGQTAWLTAAWIGAVGTSRQWQLLIGPDTLAPLAAGNYSAWVRVTDVTEVPVRMHTDTLKVT